MRRRWVYRKVVGAYRLQLIRQFIGESALLAFIALLFAVSLVELSLPLFNRLIGQQLVVEYTSISAILGLAGVALVTGIVAGSYPAFFLSAFQPVTVLKGRAACGFADFAHQATARGCPICHFNRADYRYERYLFANGVCERQGSGV